MHVYEEQRIGFEIDKPNGVVARFWRDRQRQNHRKFVRRGICHLIDEELRAVIATRKDIGIGDVSDVL